MSMRRATSIASILFIAGLWTPIPACTLASGPGNNGGDQSDDQHPDDTGDAPDDGDGSSDNQGDGGQPGAKLATFEDPDSDFSTSDVHDVDDEIVRFDTETQAIVWAEDDSQYDTGSWAVNGNLLGIFGSFQVRFGNVDGARRAYFTETGPATICDIRVQSGRLLISPTSVTVPQ